MDPITITLLAALLLGGGFGGYYWYEKHGPGAAASSSNAQVQITLDSSLPSGDQQAVIAAIMTQTSPAALQALATKYAAYPWAVYELNYRIWQLGGSQGAPPAQPTTPATPATPAMPQQPPLVPQPPVVIPPPGVVTPPAPPAPAAPPSGPFDLSAAAIAGAWQTNSAFISAYQGALLYLAYKYAQPTWAPAGVTGSYDTSTQSAVTAFQTSNAITPTGQVDVGTATIMAQKLTAAVTQASGQGSYAAFPAGGTGPGDSRYGAAGSPSIRGDQVHGMGEGVQGLGEEKSGALGEGVQGLGEDRSGGLGEGVQGLGEEKSGGARRIRTAGLGEDVQGLGEGVQGLGEDEVQGVLKKKAAQVVGAAMVAPPAAPRPRPRGGWYLRVRPTDSVWPRRVTEIGSGVHRGTQGSLQHLTDINPHLAPGGVLRAFRPGDEINVPASWATALRQKGFDVQPDESEGLL